MSDPVHVIFYCVSYMSDPVHVIFCCVSYMSDPVHVIFYTQQNHHIFINHHTETQDKYTYIRYINNYATNRISIHSLFIIIILYFEYSDSLS
jgi:hypothetical protein